MVFLVTISFTVDRCDEGNWKCRMVFLITISFTAGHCDEGNRVLEGQLCDVPELHSPQSQNVALPCEMMKFAISILFFSYFSIELANLSKNSQRDMFGMN
jgi:hypothetical protein